MDKINLIPTPPWGQGEIRALLCRHLMCVCAVVVVACVGVSIARSVAQCSDISDRFLESQAGDELTRCRAELQALRRSHQLFVDGKNSRGRPFHIVRVFESTMPADVWLRELVVSEKGIEVVGVSPTETSVGKFFGSLRAVQILSQPHLESSQVATDSSRDVREFRISAIFAIEARQAGVPSEKGL